eukprot:TRINITY_DN14469_c0_g1_i1.p1 TRINITY_DN14469_c0_g1~~TRINITY_DN14469_c0_g1_i1.p1  ORF type:complete len:620 (+),score=122.20 TRINITY_DN14469_c0_g1_i1:196-1860(+)
MKNTSFITPVGEIWEDLNITSIYRDLSNNQCPEKLTCKYVQYTLIFHIRHRLIQRILKTRPNCTTSPEAMKTLSHLYRKGGLSAKQTQKLRKSYRLHKNDHHHHHHASHQSWPFFQIKVTCQMPFQTDCIGHAWNEWSLELMNSKQSINRTHFYHTFIPPERPFLISSIYPIPHHYSNHSWVNPSHIQIVTFYAPNIFLPSSVGYQTKCNQMHCLYQHLINAQNTTDEREEWEIYAADVGDVSLVICPKPQRYTEHTFLRLMYDFDTLSHPIRYVLDSTPLTIDRLLPRVFLSACAIVKGEGATLHEWIEYHLLVGYERIILYDNNQKPDPVMNRLVRRYSSLLVVRPWPQRHSQTEAYTDCIIRFSETTEWMSLLDADEFIVPALGFSSIPEILRLPQISANSYLHANWLTFGPCSNTSLLPFRKTLIMERCTNTTKPSSPNPKPTFKIKDVAAMQGYGPHYVKLRSDLNIVQRSAALNVSNYFAIYHYRYRTWAEYVSRRIGDIAGLTDSWTPEKLDYDWAQGMLYSKPLHPSNNHILRFVPELKKRLFGLV